MPPIDCPLSIRNLSMHYHQQETAALNDISLDFSGEKMTAIIGPNGAGKSSLLKGALGLAPIETGRALFFGKPLPETRRKIAYVPQKSAIDWDFPINVREVVQQGLIADTKPWHIRPPKHHRAIALQALEQVGLSDYAERQIGKLSGGQQQRMFIARALAQSLMPDGARLFILDEPFAGVDAITETTIMYILRSLVSQGKTVIAVHHNLQTVSEYFDDVVLLNSRLIAHGRVASVFTDEAIARTYLPAPCRADEAGQGTKASTS